MRKLISWLVLLVVASGACRFELQQIQGRISVAGNEPFSYVRLVDARRQEYRLVGEEAAEIRRTLQGREVELRGRIVREAVGPGIPAEFRVEEILVR